MDTEILLIVGIVSGIVCLIVHIVFAFMFNKIAWDKGYDSMLVLCLLFGMIVYVYIAALPDLELRRTSETILKKMGSSGTEGKSILFNNSPDSLYEHKTGEEWKCKHCGDHNPNSTTICRGCGKYK